MTVLCLTKIMRQKCTKYISDIDAVALYLRHDAIDILVRLQLTLGWYGKKNEKAHVVLVS